MGGFQQAKVRNKLTPHAGLPPVFPLQLVPTDMIIFFNALMKLIMFSHFTCNWDVGLRHSWGDDLLFTTKLHRRANQGRDETRTSHFGLISRSTHVHQTYSMCPRVLKTLPGTHLLGVLRNHPTLLRRRDEVTKKVERCLCFTSGEHSRQMLTVVKRDLTSSGPNAS